MGRRLSTFCGLALTIALGTGGAYAADTSGSSDIIDESIQSVDIKDGQVHTSDLGGNSVNSLKIADGAVSPDKIATGAITPTKIQPESVSAGQLTDYTVTYTLQHDLDPQHCEIDDVDFHDSQAGDAVFATPVAGYYVNPITISQTRAEDGHSEKGSWKFRVR